MNRVVHRQPVWGWSLILLSTLLLPPSSAMAMLHVLTRTSSASVPRGEVGYLPTPRRADDHEALRAAAESGRLKVIRLEPEREGETLAVLVPTRSVVRIGDLAAPAPPTGCGAGAAIRAARPPGRHDPRAPPL